MSKKTMEIDFRRFSYLVTILIVLALFVAPYLVYAQTDFSEIPMNVIPFIKEIGLIPFAILYFLVRVASSQADKWLDLYREYWKRRLEIENSLLEGKGRRADGG